MTPDLPADVPVEPPQTTITLAAAQAPAQVIRVDSYGYHYEVIGNTLLDPEVIRTVLQDSVDPKAAFANLNQAYQKAGYFLVALRGNLDEKTFTIQVTEGRITAMDIPPNLQPYFSGLEERDDLTRSQVVRRAALAELYSARQVMRPKLKFEPAQEVGGSQITVTEEPIEGANPWPWSAGLNFGNYGNRYSSRFLVQGNAALRIGNGIELTGGYTHGLPNLNSDSEGSSYNAGIVGGSIVTPWGIYGASYNRVDYQLGKISEPLNTAGNYRTWNVYGSQLLHADEVWRWGLNEGYTHTDYSNIVFETIPLSDQNYNFVNLGTSFSRLVQPYELKGNLSGSLNYSRGISGTIKIVGQEYKYTSETRLVPDTDFNLFNWNVGYTQNLPASLVAGVSLTGQDTNTTLPLNQQWVLGGYGNLTAWFPGVVAGDKGMLGRASLSRNWEWGPVTLTPSVFLEAGYSKLDFVPSRFQGTQFLSDVGIGLAANLKSGTSLTMGSAAPLGTRGTERYQTNDNRAYFYFNLNQSLP